VPINWQITWHTIPLPRSKQAGSPHHRHPAQGGVRLRLRQKGPMGLFIRTIGLVKAPEQKSLTEAAG
jgi:hypothetical protein